MPSLCCFRFKKIDPAPSSKRNRLTHRSQRPIPSPLHAPPPVPGTGTPQPLSHSQARTSTQRPQRRTPEAPWPGPRPLIDRAATLQKPLASSPAIPQSPSRDTAHCYPSSRNLARGSINIHPARGPRQLCRKTDTHFLASLPINHPTGMARSRPRNDGPQCREETLALLEGRTPNKLSLNQRMSQPSTSSAPAQLAPHPEQTAFDDANSSSSSSSEIDLFHEDSGYSSTLLSSPVKKKQHRISNSATNQKPTFPFLPQISISSPTTLNTFSPVICSMGEGGQYTSEPRRARLRAPALCDHRTCLRHKRSCLEHHPRSPPESARPRRQSTYRRRRTGGEEEVSQCGDADGDLWVGVGTELGSGSRRGTVSWDV